MIRRAEGGGRSDAHRRVESRRVSLPAGLERWLEPDAAVEAEIFQIRNVLCPVDFFPASERALEYAVRLAGNYQATLHVLHVVGPNLPTTYIDTTTIIRNLMEDAHRSVQDLARKAEAVGIETHTAVRAGEIASELRTAVDQYGIDLVAMGTHGRRGVERWFLCSVTESLLRHLPVPILTIGHVKEGKPVPPNIQRILVTTDFSAGTAGAVAYALSVAQAEQATISMLHVIRDADGLSEHYAKALDRGMHVELEAMVPREARNWCNVRTVVESGIPYQRILQIVEGEQADLLVMNIMEKDSWTAPCLELRPNGSFAPRRSRCWPSRPPGRRRSPGRVAQLSAGAHLSAASIALLPEIATHRSPYSPAAADGRVSAR